MQKNTVLVAAVILAGAVTHTGAFFLGRAAGQRETRPAPARQPIAQCDSGGASKEDRNAVWNVWNSATAGTPDPDIPNSAPKLLGFALSALLSPDELDPQIRQNGWQMLMQKAAFSIPQEEQRTVLEALQQGTPQERVAALRRVVASDAAASALARAVLADEARVTLFLEKKQIPLE
jgi:hypothetical protein